MDSHSQKAWKWWKKFGEKPICLAPMAEISDLSWRMLIRNHGVKVCWTGMLNAHQWSQGSGYQNKFFNTCPEDHPLIAQIAGSNEDQDLIVAAAKDLAKYADGVDVNLGCTQKIASRSEYGYFMVDNCQKREKTLELFRRLCKEVNCPICAKIRIFIDDSGEVSEKITIDFAKKLEEAGVSLLQVHGRAEHRNKQADVYNEIIKHIVQAVNIPVVANGGINTVEDAHKFMEETGAAGVSVAQALLKDPTAFDPTGKKPRKDYALEYLNLSKEKGVRFFGPKKHIFIFYEKEIRENKELAKQIEQSTTIEQLIEFVNAHP
ncbi:dihydrouridine synthase, putative [Trichomonas vaginalis G3]|uniref:tRNA-dihydrouridine synthase n=1 Tax=Trichomonas vaginalis (strain ATCC PRA-98 / G3) TaxID=412133 RepID=A2EF32_TRIV3|nr:tRNA dihydrouridine synthase protein [Trichomonas vaginalis G3]EAY08748.1 dihydrouridine synthase, putative [Trichomonas vaginalis G3]KAI5507170.1 tRNA dihydrouridine synthase protein [Trichomonas vaginalis G3]|eukprot:XP_001320971.1 dihydrouridine synthase [Trichomonas vaginalis G3]